MNKILPILLLPALLTACSAAEAPPETVVVVETVIVEVEKEPETEEIPAEPVRDPDRLELTVEGKILVLPDDRDFTKLTVISGDGNLRDITALAEVPQITELYLESWSLTDISPLAGLTELTDLTLAAGTTNLTPLSGLTNLERLELGANRLDDCAVFSGMTKLRELSLWGNLLVGTENISALTQLESLKKLTVGGTRRNLTEEQIELLREQFAHIELILN